MLSSIDRQHRIYDNYLDNSLIKSLQYVADRATRLSSSAITSHINAERIVSDAQQQLTDAINAVWNQFQNLANQAIPLYNENFTTAFQQPTITSDNPTALTATAATGASDASYQVGIYQLASAQSNMGLLLSGSDTGFSDGITTSTQFSQQVTFADGSSFVNSFTVNAADTNETVLQNFITALKYNVSRLQSQLYSLPSVEGGANYNLLTLESTTTGTDNAFTLTDLTGNFVSASGIDSIYSRAQNASYSVNYLSQTSQSNEIALDNGMLNLTLRKTALSPLTLTVHSQGDGIPNTMAGFIQDYNNSVLTLQSHAAFLHPRTLKDLTQFASDHPDALADIGIQVQSDRSLSFDPSAFQQALQQNSNTVQNLLSGDSGLISRALQVAQDTTTSPLAHLFRFYSSAQGNTPNSFPLLQYNSYAQWNMLKLIGGSFSGSLINTPG